MILLCSRPWVHCHGVLDRFLVGLRAWFESRAAGSALRISRRTGDRLDRARTDGASDWRISHGDHDRSTITVRVTLGCYPVNYQFERPLDSIPLNQCLFCRVSTCLTLKFPEAAGFGKFRVHLVFQKVCASPASWCQPWGLSLTQEHLAVNLREQRSCGAAVGRSDFSCGPTPSEEGIGENVLHYHQQENQE